MKVLLIPLMFILVACSSPAYREGSSQGSEDLSESDMEAIKKAQRAVYQGKYNRAYSLDIN